MPLFNFIKLVTTDNLDWLIKEGKPANLEHVWEKIHNEYTALTNDITFSTGFRLTKDIYKIFYTLHTMRALINVLSIRYNPELAKRLKKITMYGLSYSEDTIDTDLDITINRMKSLELRLKQLQDEKLLLDSKNKSGATEADYYDSIAVLEKWRGGSIDPKNTTVMQFISLSNLLKKENNPDGKRGKN